MKLHSTNYFDTFIQVAEDTKAECGTKPPAKSKKTVAEMQCELIAENPYQYTSDDIFFQVFAERNGLTEADYPKAREDFPEPDTPAIPTILFSGIYTSICFRL